MYSAQQSVDTKLKTEEEVHEKDEEGEKVKEPYSIYVVGHNAFLWDPAAVVSVRARHRIVGSLAGTLPRLPQQNVFLGLPLWLMKEEVNVLMEEGLAVLVDDAAACAYLPTDAELETFARQLQTENDRFADLKAEHTRNMERWGRERNSVESNRRIDMSALGSFNQENKETGADFELHHRRTNREDEVAEQEGKTEPQDPVSSSCANTDTLSSVKLPSEVTPQPPKLPPIVNTLMKTPTNLPWRSKAEKASTFDSLEKAREAGIWNFPNLSEERARMAVYRDLRTRGYFVTNGSKFGGEFLVYQGDPFLVHSSFVTTILGSPPPSSSCDSSEPGSVICSPAIVSAVDLIALSRLGTAARKSRLLCGWKDDQKSNSGPEYFTVRWSGFG